MYRCHFLQNTAAALAAAAWSFSPVQAAVVREPEYWLALGQSTFNRVFRGVEGVTRRDLPEFSSMAGELGIAGVDYSGIQLGEHHANSKSLADGITQLLKFSVPMKLDVLIESHEVSLQTDGAGLASAPGL